jgi:hypothetical protein
VDYCAKFRCQPFVEFGQQLLLIRQDHDPVALVPLSAIAPLHLPHVPLRRAERVSCFVGALPLNRDSVLCPSIAASDVLALS